MDPQPSPFGHLGGFSAGIAAMPPAAYAAAPAQHQGLAYGLHFPPIAANRMDANGSFPYGQQQAQQPQAQQQYGVQMDVSGFTGYDDSGIPESYINGAIELSAGAKPFVPRTFMPSTTSTPVVGPPQPAVSAPVDPVPAPPAPISFPASALGGLWSSSSSSSSILPLPASTFGFLSSASLSLGGGVDHFDFDVNTDIMPDLDSLLSHEDHHQIDRLS